MIGFYSKILWIIKFIIYWVIEFVGLRWYNINENEEEKGEIEMSACAIKPVMPFATRSKLGRTPATEDNRKMVEFMDSHNFSFDIDAETKTLKCTTTEK